ncbi:MAG TPA: exopolysaccharide biosynthesis protein, partial [Candidatus Obscuribacterales bacterium]
LPNLFFFVTGSSVLTGLPLIVLALQLVAGRSDVWLPRFVADRSIERTTFSRIVTVSVPYVEWIERLAKPRWWPTSYLLAERIIGFATLFLAIFLFLPIPFANGLPALSIILLALGLSERDGYWLAGGLSLSMISMVLAAGMVFVGTAAVLELILH